MPATISQINGLNITAESASYAATASYSTTLGASISNPSPGDIRLLSSNGNMVGFINNLTASLASTASLALATSSSIVTDATAYRVALLAANNQNIVRTSGTNISYQPDIGQLQVPSVLATSGVTASLQGTASWATNALTASLLLGSVTSASFASTASSVNTLNQNVIIANSLAVGTSSLGSGENTLTVGLPSNGGTGEGGQILLMASGGLYSSASMLDNYQNKFRVLRGTNAGSDTFKMQIDLHTGQVQIPNYTGSGAFPGTAAATLAVDSSGNVITTTGGGSSISYQTIVGSATGLAAATTRYGNVAGSTSEGQQRVPVPVACTMSNLYVRTTATMNASATLTVTIFKNGSSTAVTLTIAGGSAAGTYSDTSNSATFAEGDGFNIQFTNAGSATAAASSGQGYKITI